MKMIIRDGHATISGDETTHELPSGSLDIVSDDGRTLFGITLQATGAIRIDAGSVCKFQGVPMDEVFAITPVASNVVEIFKLPA